MDRADALLFREHSETEAMIRRVAWTPLPPTGGRVGIAAMAGSVGAALIVAVAGPMAAIALVVVTALGLMTAYMPGVLFAIYLLSGIYKAAWQPYSPIDTTLVLALLNGLQVIPLILGRRPGGTARLGVIMLAAVGILYLAGVLYAPNQSIAIGYVGTFWALSLLPMVPAAIRVGSRPEYLRQFLWTLFAFGIPMTVFGLLQLGGVDRLEVFGASTIEVSRTALLIPLIWGAFILRQRGLLVRAATLMLIPAAMVVAVASGSRGPLLALAAIGFFAAVRYFARPGRVNWRIAGTVAAATLASVVALSAVGQALPGMSLVRFTLFEDFVSRFVGGEFNPSIGDTSSGRRVVLYEAAVSMFQERPLLGYGTGGFQAASPRFTGPPFYAWPHNAALQFAAEFGLVGVALFGGLCWVTLTRRFPRDHLGNAVRIVFAFFLLNAMVSDDIYGGRPLWGLFALVLLISLPTPVVEVERGLVRTRSGPTRRRLASASTPP